VSNRKTSQKNHTHLMGDTVVEETSRHRLGRQTTDIAIDVVKVGRQTQCIIWIRNAIRTVKIRASARGRRQMAIRPPPGVGIEHPALLVSERGTIHVEIHGEKYGDVG
jgi:hypothetical protein